MVHRFFFISVSHVVKFHHERLRMAQRLLVAHPWVMGFRVFPGSVLLALILAFPLVPRVAAGLQAVAANVGRREVTPHLLPLCISSPP